MPQVISVGIKDLCAKAKAEINEVEPAEAARKQAEEGAQIVDIRDIRELWRDGCIPGAYHAPRGMLEFWVDPESPYHKPVFAGDGPFIFCCAGGLRSALAAQAVQNMGLTPVYNLIGGFKAWSQAGLPVAAHDKSK